MSISAMPGPGSPPAGSLRRPWLPGAVRAELEDDPRPLTGRRSPRDVVVDILVIALAAFIGLVGALPYFHGHTIDLPVDLTVGAIGCLLLVWRRRWPLPIAIIVNIMSIPFAGAGGAAYLAIFSLAVHRPFRHSIGVAALGIAAGMANLTIIGDENGFFFNAMFLVLLIAVAVGWGTSVRNRRQLLISLAERARRAESEQRERLGAARATERERLAREMHDVLAHRMSLLSVHAGALEYRPDAPAEDIARAAGVIRSGVHQMLEDLRDVILMLREESDDLAAETHSLPDVPSLFAEARQAGAVITPHIEVDRADDVPGVVGRAAFRIVQEGLTNARKHGGRVPVAVDIAGGPGHGLSISVSQPLNHSIGLPEIPGTGTGLTGLNERVTLAGGELMHGVIDHRFVLSARLPWETGAVDA
ncbi:histidine kinase [Williamsia herbipolensis]|uniref:histidine kinase n=1 Tax=Williamsia herbipolensis TaxID=1603258 RepID=A0AAU4JX27_9NOCA|nr:histidine kinase [Williamsia herbipolensis]